jgi:uncharacterized membrane-anchored protein YhcB (DUF1043 family)
VDPVYLVWLVSIGALVGGGIIGVIVYRNLAPNVREASNLKRELEQARQELDSYKTRVSGHFEKTSELVKELTQDYVKVYQHLAEGAQALGDSKTFINQLEQQKGKVLITVDDRTEPRDTMGSGLPAGAHRSRKPARTETESFDEAVVPAADFSPSPVADAAPAESPTQSEATDTRPESTATSPQDTALKPAQTEAEPAAPTTSGKTEEIQPESSTRRKQKTASKSAKTETEPA